MVFAPGLEIIVLEIGKACEIEAIDVKPAAAVKGGGRVDAMAARSNAVRVSAGQQRLLHERVHLALTIPLRGVQLALSFSYHGDVRWQLGRRTRTGVRGDAEHDAQFQSLAVRGTCKAHTHSVAGRARAAFTLQIGAAPVELLINGAAQAEAQVTTFAGQAGIERRPCLR